MRYVRSVGVAAGLAMVAAAFVGSPVLAQTPVQDGAPLCGVEEGPAQAEPAGTLRVGTYNILHTQPDLADRSMDVRIELIADEIDDHGPTVVGLQEVTWSDNHGVVAQRLAAALVERQGHDWSWCMYASNPHCPGEPDAEPGGRGGECSGGIAAQARSGDAFWYEGVALVSRYPIEVAQAHRLVGRAQEIPLCAVEQPDNPLCVPTLTLDTRTVVHTRLDTPWGGFDYFVSHLANNETSQSELTRQLQVEDALMTIDGWATDDDLPDIYVGDFNTLEGGAVWQAVIDAGFVDSYREAEPDADGWTSGQELGDPSPTVEKRIDYVFARPGACPLTPRAGEIMGDEPAPFEDGVVWPSDHYGVAVTLGLGEPCRGAPAASGDDAGSDGADADASGPTELPVTGAAFPAGLVVMLAMGQLTRRRSGDRLTTKMDPEGAGR